MPLAGAFLKAAKYLGEGAFPASRAIGRGGAAVADKTQGLITGMSARGMKINPYMAGPAAYFGTTFTKDVMVDPIMEGFTENPYSDAIQASKERYRGQQMALRTRLEYENLQRRMQQATMRLAVADPHLYNEVMAGRSLPKDAVVFGGQPRTDLMEELAMSMAQDQFKEPPSAQDELMQELGV